MKNKCLESERVMEAQLHIPTVMILSFWTDMAGQTVQTQIRLLEQSDQGIQCLPFRLHRLDSLLYCRATYFKFLRDENKYFGCPNI